MSSFAPYQDARNLITAANLLPANLIQWSNESFDQPDASTNSMWMTVDAYSPNISLLDIGAAAYQENGTIRFIINTPAGSGTSNIRVLAKNVANTFRNLGARNPFYSNASITETNSDDGMWYAMVVSVDFTYQDILA